MDYESIKNSCEANSKISGNVIDDFLIYYAASQNKLEQTMELQFKRYRHVLSGMQVELVNMQKAQYLAHAIFKEGGLIKKILNHAALKRLSEAEMEYLRNQSETPWRFSFSVIVERPAPDFFLMQDIFTQETYLLYSKSTTALLKEQPGIVWYNLIAFNGACWQTFGPIGPFVGFEPDDIFFYASEVNPSIENDTEVQAEIERNPLPYMMLLSKSNIPLTFNKEDQLIQCLTEYDAADLDTRLFGDDFRKEYNEDVYCFHLKNWDIHPHFAHFYYDEKIKIVLLSAFTETGYRALVKRMNEAGLGYSYEAAIRVNPSILVVAKEILRKEIVLNEYEGLFVVDKTEAEQKNLDEINELMALLLPDINAGTMPDVEALAKKTGIEAKTIMEIVETLRNKLGN